MENLSVLASMALVLGIALFGGLVARRLRLPVILGYLVSGVIIGPNALGLIENIDDVETLAIIGVALLMFTLGVDFSLRSLQRAGRIAIFGGITQVIITAGLGFGIGLLAGYSHQESFLFGLFISISSTTIVLKVLRDRGELGTPHGRIMTGILLIQDLSVVPMMAIIPAMGGSGTDLAIDVGLALLKAIVFLGATILLGLYGFDRFMKVVAGERSRELFLISIVCICLLAGVTAEYLGLSIALGAFLAGLLVSESDYAHQALADTKPLRDIFAVLFFASLGMLANPEYIADNPWKITAVVLAIVFGKMLIISGITRLFGYGSKTTLFTGGGLFQIGEFSFILAAIAFQEELIKYEIYDLTLAVAFITIILTPLSLGLISKVYFYLAQSKKIPLLSLEDRDEDMTGTAYRLSSHVVICGYGRVARKLLRTLNDTNIPHLIVDFDPRIIEKARSRGIPYIFGDASRAEVLAATNLQKCAVLVVSLPDPLATRLVVKNALRINPAIYIVARVHHDEEVEMMQELGVNGIVWPEKEAGLEIIRLTLLRFGLNPEATDKTTFESKEEQTS